MSDYIKSLRIMSKEETVDIIVRNKYSCARFGDGEFAVMAGDGNGFQRSNAKLGERLKEVIISTNPNLLVCIPLSLKDTKSMTLNSKLSAYGYRHCFLKKVVMPCVTTSKTYGDALFTRFYMARKDKSHTAEYVKMLKQLWDGEDMLIVEGKYSRLGVGNDLFDNAHSIKRILCPQENAFDKYNTILDGIISNYCGELILLAVGMTATVLACDLANKNIRALDLGHIDIEYEWFRMGATHKTSIPGKQMSECEGDTVLTMPSDTLYKNQIIADYSS